MQLFLYILGRLFEQLVALVIKLVYIFVSIGGYELPCSAGHGHAGRTLYIATCQLRLPSNASPTSAKLRLPSSC